MNTPQHKKLYQQRVPNQLRLQSMQIERVMDAHAVEATVAGGELSPERVHFDLQTRMAAGMEKLRALKDDLLGVLGVGDVQLRQENGRWRVEVAQPEEVPVPLLPLLNYIDALPDCAAPIGITEEGEPVLLELLGENLSHVHIFGDPGSGKTSLLRTLAVALALHNRQSSLQMVLLAPAAQGGAVESALSPLNYLPHLLEPVTASADDAVHILQFLVEEARYRLQEEISTPTIVLMVDNVSRLLEDETAAAVTALQYLARQGLHAGICLVIGSEAAEIDALGAAFRSCVSVRIIGHVADEESVQLGAELADLDLHPAYLNAEGEFLAVAGGVATPFQAAYIADYDLHLVLDTLHRQRARALLAHPVPPKSGLADHAPDRYAGNESVPFVVKEGDVTYALNEADAAPAPDANVGVADDDGDSAPDFEDDDDRIPFDAGLR